VRQLLTHVTCVSVCVCSSRDTRGHGCRRWSLTRWCLVSPVQTSRFTAAVRTTSQFCQLYYQRLMTFLPRLKAAAQERWPDLPACKVLQLQDGQQCVVIGTLYKDMKLKPSVLDEYAKNVRCLLDRRSANPTLIHAALPSLTSAGYAADRDQQLQVRG